MIWIAPTEIDTAKSGLMAQEYSAPIPGINFLRFAEGRFAAGDARRQGVWEFNQPVIR